MGLHLICLLAWLEGLWWSLVVCTLMVWLRGLMLVAYGYYHFSGVREKVDAAQRLVETLRPQKKRVRAAVNSLRQTVRSYFAFIPGMGYLVDKAFDELDKLAAKSQHLDAVENHIERAVADISDVLQNYGVDRSKEAAMQICSICLRLGKELANEAGQAAAPATEGMVQGANSFISTTSGIDTKYHEAKTWVSHCRGH